MSEMLSRFLSFRPPNMNFYFVRLLERLGNINLDRVLSKVTRSVGECPRLLKSYFVYYPAVVLSNLVVLPPFVLNKSALD